MPMIDNFEPRTVITALTFIAAFASILALVLPFVRRDDRGRRIEALKQDREALRRATQARLDRQRQDNRLPRRHVTLMRKILERLRLGRLLSSKSLRARLSAAGYRAPQAPTIYLFLRLALPVVLGVLGAVLLGVGKGSDAATRDILIIGAMVGFGALVPPILLKNAADKRAAEITLYFPDALDLMVICTEAGLSVDAAFARVTEEMAETSPVLAQELGITAAEQAFLGDRRVAYMNLAERTGVPAARALATALIQSEKYGTPVSQALKVLSKENREERLSRAERKAAALPAQLTVPMIVFFLPVLVAVIIGPAIIKVMAVW